MKRILTFATLLSFMYVACKHTEKISQAGVYKLDKLTVSGGGKDTVYARTQMKIYTPSYFAYFSFAPDSSVGFGVGSYRLDTGNQIIEYNVYSSRALDSTQIFHVRMNRAASGYTQTISLGTLRGVKYDEIEKYSKVASSGTSKMDGLWKLDSSYIVKNTGITNQKEVQYKIFWGGHFMFVHRYPLNNGAVFKNGFGYGTFSLKNDTLSEEEDITSHAILLNHQFAIKIDFRGNDEYKQVITDPKTGDKSVEVYKRMQ
ncbi:MAG TPA: hypothetical protein VHE59_13925 [Mucilaginibacter sp.]|nr:hypothetical protein [Mucilaginibacter sp.]